MLSHTNPPSYLIIFAALLSETRSPYPSGKSPSRLKPADLGSMKCKDQTVEPLINELVNLTDPDHPAMPPASEKKIPHRMATEESLKESEGGRIRSARIRPMLASVEQSLTGAFQMTSMLAAASK
jgi:hypothetical protein